jgi:hypothetical protein
MNIFNPIFNPASPSDGLSRHADFVASMRELADNGVAIPGILPTPAEAQAATIDDIFLELSDKSYISKMSKPALIAWRQVTQETFSAQNEEIHRRHPVTNHQPFSELAQLGICLPGFFPKPYGVPAVGLNGDNTELPPNFYISKLSDPALVAWQLATNSALSLQESELKRRATLEDSAADQVRLHLLSSQEIIDKIGPVDVKFPVAQRILEKAPIFKVDRELPRGKKL